MTLIRHEAAAHHVCVVGDVRIPGGEAREVPDELAEAALADPHARLSVVDPEPIPEDGETPDPEVSE